MLDESAKKIVDGIGQHIEDNRRRIRTAHKYPIDRLPVNVNEIAHYRGAYLAALDAHNETLGAVQRLLAAGGNDTVTLWAQVYDDDGCDSGIRAERPDGDR